MTIYIYSGRVNTGKTTRLLAWAESGRDAGGILEPVVERARMIHDLETGRRFALSRSREAGDDEDCRIGPFAFSGSAFRRARSVLRRAFLSRPAWLVIDEIGPLELAGRGLEPTAGRIIRWCNARPGPPNLLLVVRAELLDAVRKRYGIRSWRRFSPPD